MDIKITGVTFDILRDALEQARKGRLFILGKMAEAIDGPREELSQYAPRDRADQDRPGEDRRRHRQGRRDDPRPLQEEFEAEIDVEDDGTVQVYAPSGELVEACIARIEAMTKEAEVGDRYTGAKVVKTTTFGAFVELTKGTDGLLHISNVKPRRAGRHGRGRAQRTATRSTSPWSRWTSERGRIGLRLSDDPRSRARAPRSWPRSAPATAAARGGNGGDRGGRGGRDGRRPRGERPRARR